MGLFHFLIVLMGLIAAGLVAVILMQQSEGGGLGVGGSPSGLMSARGAADFMTRLTAILATLFIITAIALAAVASNRSRPEDIDSSFERETPSVVGDATEDAASDTEVINDGMVTPADANAGEEVPLTR